MKRRTQLIVAAGVIVLLLGALSWLIIPARYATTDSPPLVASEISRQSQEQVTAARSVEAEPVAAIPPLLSDEVREPASTSPLGTIGGRVFTPNGEGVEGVELTLYTSVEKSAQRYDLTRQATAESGADGRFEFEALGEGAYRIWIAPGRAVGVRVLYPRMTVELGEGEQRLDLDVALGWADSLEGIVTDLEGNPIEGATVSTIDATATTGPDGRYRLDSLPMEAPIDLFARADGYERIHRPNVMAYRGDQDFALARRANITVVAQDRDGNPLTAYTLLARLDYGMSLSPRFAQKTVEAPDGRSVLPQLAVGQSYHIEVAQIDEQGRQTGEHGAIFFIPSSDAEEVVVRIGGDPINLWVLEGSRGEDVATGVDLRFSFHLDGPLQRGSADLRTIASVTSNEHGVAHLDELIPGVYRVRISSPYNLLNPDIQSSLIVRHEGLTAECVPPLVRVSTGVAVRGRIYNRDDQPRGGMVMYAQNMSIQSVVQHTSTADTEGYFEFGNLPPAKYRIYTNQDQVYREQLVEVTKNFDEFLEFRPEAPVLIFGDVSHNGTPRLPSMPFPVAIVSSESLHHAVGLFESEGKHQTTILPGSYRLRWTAPRTSDRTNSHYYQLVATGQNPWESTTSGQTTFTGYTSYTEPFSVSEEPIRQPHDFHLRTGWIDIMALDAALGELWNHLTVEQYCTSNGELITSQRVEVAGDSWRVGPAFEGIYVVRGENPNWTSGPVEVSADDPGTIFVLSPAEY